ncbi:unnamed protein product [Cyprideis torosa]|uniref:Uncharacterized protein n=1 Tax=Cyprideis torosa TaxID=163714 RepID=A0A7R8W129_9CRUS|nr:unnamed protein product [Cyprideis torosa]CAG0880400.1 unnamed protein product [Cyprideis torosa]
MLLLYRLCSPLISPMVHCVLNGPLSKATSSALIVSYQSVARHKRFVPMSNVRFFSRREDSETALRELGEKPKRLRTQTQFPMITLNHSDGQVEVLSLDHAAKLAKARNMSLLKVENEDSKTGRATYKLFTERDMLFGGKQSNEPGKKKDEGKNQDFKTLPVIRSNISDNDLNSRVNQLMKWLKKGLLVRVVIEVRGDQAKANQIVETISKSVEEVNAEVTKKTLHQKGNLIRFSVKVPAASATFSNEPSPSSSS